MGNFSIEKVLSANDSGETGGHQAGILVPKSPGILSFFPKLGSEEKNPRFALKMKDSDGKNWTFNYIYYNNKYFGGTRNEFRLTGMTKYFKQNNLKVSDSIILTLDSEGRYFVAYKRANVMSVNQGKTLKLGNTWKVITIKK